MPLLVLLLLAFVTGTLAWLVARRPLGGHGRDGHAPAPALEAARDLGAEAGRHPALRRALRSRLQPDEATGLALTVALLVIVAGGLVLGALALLVRSTDGLIGIDTSAANWGDRHATSLSTHGLKLVTDLGATWLVAVGVVVLVVLERHRGGSRWAVPFLLAVVLGDKLLNVTIKGAVDRVRPTLNPVAQTLGPSFPSGHTSTAAAFWAAAALVAGRWCAPRVRPALAGVAVGIAFGVAASRVLLDVHWLTDVIGGLALGWAWFAVCAIAFGGRLLRFGAGARAAAAEAQAGADTRPERRPARGGPEVRR